MDKIKTYDFSVSLVSMTCNCSYMPSMSFLHVSVGAYNKSFFFFGAMLK